MSCYACEEAHENGEGAFFRLGSGNVWVGACREHLREMQRLIRGEIQAKDAH